MPIKAILLLTFILKDPVRDAPPSSSAHHPPILNILETPVHGLQHGATWICHTGWSQKCPVAFNEVNKKVDEEHSVKSINVYSINIEFRQQVIRQLEVHQQL